MRIIIIWTLKSEPQSNCLILMVLEGVSILGEPVSRTDVGLRVKMHRNDKTGGKVEVKG